MANALIETVISENDNYRNRSINSLLQNKNINELLQLTKELESFRKSTGNLYRKVRASLFLYFIYRFHLQASPNVVQHGTIPFEGVKESFDRNFEKSIEIFLYEIENGNQNSSIFSAIAESYYYLAFKFLLDQVKLSISQCKMNYHLFNIDNLDDYPYVVSERFTTCDPVTELYPVGFDFSPVRLDPSHSGWSDIFFLGMDFPEGAKVVNISVNLKIHGAEGPMAPPCECYCRFIEEPVIRLTSVDLKASKKISKLNELFNFGDDYLSLLKAGVVASGIIPPCFENKDISLQDILKKLLNKPGGIEVVTRVNNIPKGSRLAVSTTLLSTIIARLMRFSGQTKNQDGSLTEEERRIAASRAILGEWLGGSGGGWQDSGGLWPGIKIITGKLAEQGNPEYGISRGCLLPEHELFSREDIPEEVEKKIVSSMVLVHGGISQDVGPILEMVTDKYLLRHDKEFQARMLGLELYDKIVRSLKTGDMKELGRLTSLDWEEAIQQVIPGVNNAFTHDLIERLKEEFQEDYWGFLMLGGMSGGGMAFIINPDVKKIFKKRIAEIMHQLKNIYSSSFPFIINPVVYDFEFNHDGITAGLLTGADAKIPVIAHQESPCGFQEEISEEEIKKEYGFDSTSHEHMRSLLKEGKIGLSKNRLPLTTNIENIKDDEILHFRDTNPEFYKLGEESLRRNEVAPVTFAGGMGSRWTQGAAVVKAINPFTKMDGSYKSFMEIHLAQSRKTGTLFGHHIPHIFTTSYLTHEAIVNYVNKFNHFDYEGKIYLSPGKSIGRRTYPMERDLKFFWKEQLQQKLDDTTQKVLDDVHDALIDWAKSKGEGEDYRENKHIMRFNPPGHWYEIPNLLKNGVLAELIVENPNLKYLFCHNIDTLGAYIETGLLGMHISNNSCLTFEVTPRRIEDKGGGLAKINGQIQLVEGLALPNQEDEYKLSYYNTLTHWITIDSLLEYFKIDRELIIKAQSNADDKLKVEEAVRRVEKNMPTYLTIKNVKYIWGSGQEDVYPVAQFEKLWGDMTSEKDLKVDYVAVSRYRGQQLKEPSQLDIWLNDGSFDYVKDKTIIGGTS
jgi:UDP-N-acetylglucosamine pyrophosphorylase